MSNIFYFDSVDSTNNVLKKMAVDGSPHGTVVISSSQTQGRGRMNRSFASPAGTGLYMSILLRPCCPPISTLPLTCMCAVSVCDAIEQCCNITPDIKWVNDLQINEKKICGILTEMSISGNDINYIIVGIGINVNTKEDNFPAELQDIATSLYIQTKQEYDIRTLANIIIDNIKIMCENLFTHNNTKYYLDKYRKLNIVAGNYVNIITSHQIKSGYASKINEDFSLNIVYSDGSQEDISSCEVSVRKI